MRYFAVRDLHSEGLWMRVLASAERVGGGIALVERTAAPACDTRAEVLELMRPHLVSTGLTRRWPNTSVSAWGAPARVYRFRASPEVLSFMRASARDLAAWVHPELPEDLCAWRPDGSLWYYQTTHEDFGVFILSDHEIATFAADIVAECTEVDAMRVDLDAVGLDGRGFGSTRELG